MLTGRTLTNDDEILMTLNKYCQWRGKATVCYGECNDDEVEIHRGSDWETSGHDYKGQIEKILQPYTNFGGSCFSGTKAFCCKGKIP